MNKTKKIVIGALLSIATLGSAISYAAPGEGGFMGKKAERMVKRISSKLDLNDAQKLNLEALKTVLVSQRAEQKESGSRTALLDLLSTPVLDETKALAIMEKKSKERQAKAPALVSAIANFTNSLNDEQRAKFKTMAERMSKRGKHGKRGHGNKGKKQDRSDS